MCVPGVVVSGDWTDTVGICESKEAHLGEYRVFGMLGPQCGFRVPEGDEDESW